MKIVGMIVVRDDELYLQQACENVLDFCDEITILEDGSHDSTPDICRALEKAHDKVTFKQIKKVQDSHSHVAQYHGKDVWVFGVDGDELYDVEGLKIVREELYAGKYIENFILRGWFLHVFEKTGNIVRGYPGPPSYIPTKLFNFKKIISWKNTKNVCFSGKRVLTDEVEYHFADKFGWEDSPLRCLHMRFIPRSSYPERSPMTQMKRTIYKMGEIVTADMEDFKCQK